MGELPQKIKVQKCTYSSYLWQMEGAIQFGNPFLIENIGEDTDPAIEPVLLKQTFKQGNRVMIKIGDSTLEYSKDFKIYTTKLRNPHYLPEVAVKARFVVEGAESKQQLEDTKNKILHVLQTSQ